MKALRYNTKCLLLLASLLLLGGMMWRSSFASSSATNNTATGAAEAYFVFDAPPRQETFIVKLTDPAKIQKARDILSGNQAAGRHISGVIVKEAACYNPPWSFHLDPQSIEFFDSAIEVCDGSVGYIESHLDEVGGALLPGNRWCSWGSRLIKEITPPTCNKGVANVSAADYSRVGLATEAIVTAFGTGLATTTAVASVLPLPTTLAGTTVKIKDAAERETLAPLFFVAPTQVNYQIPASVEPGLVTVTITNTQGQAASEWTQVLSIAPGLFTANATGQGVPAASLLRIKADGSQSYEPVARFDQAQNRFVPVPIDLGASTDQVFLVIFGTGFRRADRELVEAEVGGLRAGVVYAGPQGDFTGLDQVNINLPRRLTGRGEVMVKLMVDDQKANLVTVAFN